tara:strand:- start:121 stop:354 length:234 start_codon:yes stop_codon:yes gene_type:complete
VGLPDGLAVLAKHFRHNVPQCKHAPVHGIDAVEERRINDILVAQAQGREIKVQRVAHKHRVTAHHLQNVLHWRLDTQ